MGGNSLIDRLFKRESTTKEEIRQLVDEDQAKGELEASQLCLSLYLLLLFFEG